MENLTLEMYRRMYEEIVAISYDVENPEFSILSDVSDEAIEKCRFIAAMVQVLNDVPSSKSEYILSEKKIVFDYMDFLDKIDRETPVPL